MNDSPSLAVPVLLLPGLICDARIWAPQVAALGQIMPITAVDGYGEADSLTAMADQVIKSAPSRFAVVGHSMGGRVALEIFRKVPERLAGIGLISTGVHLPKPNEADGRFALLNRGVEEGMDALIDSWLPPMVWERNRLKPQLMDMLWQMCSDAGIDMFERQIRALLARPEVESLLPQIHCPALVATGAHDAWAPPVQHERIAAAIAGATYAVIPDSGHMLPVEQPDAMSALLRTWLDRVAQQEAAATANP
ncbi:pimeloyl-ACP methyl ester carboxylesterase [Sphingobium sp. B1D7B]|uniref:alpha/beta fold hydrolase n=1 Tax=unclassified Sphingobium TaxID=2611147 RepID=UPI002224A453|nr:MULTISPECIES: alpha/beta hydrolase [unclassified Sphingobium]MCW2390734.1 pimeloyl-ACP methyl ester carboxylesterase [Sphingobium sp. B11D3A]MCW2405876.1 pimeloyl-ACP methyl ester carboxylesterase [Sphingobium sp. B1D7B]